MQRIKDVVYNAVLPLVIKSGCDLLEVEYVKEGPERYLRLVIDKSGGVGIDDCEKVSKLAEKVIDRLDPIKEAYILEVTSPGIDRPLKTDSDIKRHIGEEVEIRLYSPVEGRKSFEGILDGMDEKNETVFLKTPAKHMEFLRKDISGIKRTIKF